MEKQDILDALAKAKKGQKRNFKQTVDLIMNFKDLDLKKPENHVEVYIPLSNNRGKEAKLCAFVGPELKDNAKANVDLVIEAEEFDRYAKDKHAVKRIANEYAYFIAQASIMIKVASVFGRVLGPRGKMPNPKAGCVVPSNANLAPLAERLRRTVKVSVKKDPVFQTFVGKEDTDENLIAENVLNIYNDILNHLPNGVNNIKSVYIKTTMGSAIKIGGQAAEEKKLMRRKTETKEVKATAKVEAEAEA